MRHVKKLLLPVLAGALLLSGIVGCDGADSDTLGGIEPTAKESLFKWRFSRLPETGAAVLVGAFDDVARRE